MSPLPLSPLPGRSQWSVATPGGSVWFPLKFREGKHEAFTSPCIVVCVSDEERDPVLARERQPGIPECSWSHVTRSGHTNEVCSPSPSRSHPSPSCHPVPSDQQDGRGRKVAATLRPRDLEPHRSLLLALLCAEKVGGCKLQLHMRSSASR